MRTSRRKHSLVTDIVRGAVAGAIATWTLDQVTDLMYERESRGARRREDRARGGETAYATAAAKLARRAGVTLSRPERERHGRHIHWTLGIGAGALYGVIQSRTGTASIGRGLAYGTAFWLLMDEMATPAFGLAPGPGAFPWQTHARGLAGHLAYGAVADTSLRLLGA